MTACSMNIELNKAFMLIDRSGFTNSGQIKIFPLGQSISRQKCEVFRPLVPSLLGFSGTFICEAQLCCLVCCRFAPGARQAWSALSSCQRSGDEGVGQVTCCWVNGSWRGLHSHIIAYSFSVWASESCCQQITKNMGPVAKQREHCCLVPHHCDVARCGLLFSFFFLLAWREWILELLTERRPSKTVWMQCSSRYYHKTFIFRELRVTSCALIKNSLLTTVMLTKKRVVLFQLTMTKVLILLIFLIF